MHAGVVVVVVGMMGGNACNKCAAADMMCFAIVMPLPQGSNNELCRWHQQHTCIITHVEDGSSARKASASMNGPTAKAGLHSWSTLLVCSGHLRVACIHHELCAEADGASKLELCCIVLCPIAACCWCFRTRHASDMCPTPDAMTDARGSH